MHEHALSQQFESFSTLEIAVSDSSDGYAQMKNSGFVQAALNGNRIHPAVPRTPAELAKDTQLAVRAGASSVHVHPYDDHGCETLEPKYCAAALLVLLLYKLIIKILVFDFNA